MDDIEVPIPYSKDDLNMTAPATGDPITHYPSTAAAPSKGLHAIAAAAASAASVVGSVAAATGGHGHWSLGLAALASVLSFLGAFAKAPNTVKVAE